MPTIEYIRMLTMRAKAEGFAEASAAARGLGHAIDAVAVTSETSGKGHLSAQRAVDALERKYFSTIRAQQEFERAQRAVNTAVADNPAITDRANRALAAAKDHYDKIVASAERAAAAQKSAAQDMVSRQTITPNRGEDIAAVGKQVDDVRSKYVPLVNIQRRYLEDLEMLRSPLAKVAMSERERLDAIQHTKDAFAQQVVNMNTARGSMDKYAGASGLARHELINMSRQIQDVGVTVAMGQSPMMILMQQGTQIADIFASSQGTVRGFFGQIAEGAARIFTPTRVAIGATLGLGAAAVAVTASFQSAQRDIERNLMGIAGASRATVGDINRIAASTRSVFGLSSGEAREAAMTFAATGQIMVENIAPLVTMSDQLSRALGIGAADASKRLATAFADPARGAVELNKEFGVLDQRTLEYIRTLQAMGNTTRAQQVLMESLGPAIARQAEMISFAEKAWRGFLNLVKEGFVEIPAQAISQIFNINPGTIKQLNDAEAELRRIQDIITMGGDSPAMIAQLDAAVQKVRALRQVMDSDQADQYSRALNSIAESARQTAAAFVPEIRAIEDAGLAFNNLFLLSQRPDLATVLDKAGLTAQQFATALERAGGAYLTMLSPAQRLTEQHNLQLQSIAARSHEERIALAGKEREVQLAGASLSASERAVEIDRARARAAAEIAMRHQDAMVALEGQAAVANAAGGAAKIIAQETATRNQLLAQGFTHEQASAQAAKQRENAFSNANDRAREMLFTLQNQAGVSAAVTGEQKMQAQASATMNELLRQGVDLELAMAVAGQEFANAQAQANAAVEQQIHSLSQQTRLIEARARGDEKSVIAQQAYDNAIRSGADHTAAAALRAATLANETAKAAEQADRFAASIKEAAHSFSTGNFLNLEKPGKGGGFDVGPTPQTLLDTFLERQFGKGGATAEAISGGFGRRGSVEAMSGPITVNEQGLRHVADEILGKGGSLQQAIAEINKQASSRGGQTAAPGAEFGVLQDLYDLLSQEQGGSTAAQGQALEQQIAFLQSQPRSIERDRAMFNLIDELKNLRESTDALNTTIGLDPLFTQGHGYVGIGYNPHGGRSPRIPIDPNTEPFMPALAAPGGATGPVHWGDPNPSSGGGELPGATGPIHWRSGFSITSPGMEFIDPRTGRPIMGMADGGMFMVGGSGGVDSKYVPLGMTPGELINVTPPRELQHYGQGKQSTVVNNVTHNNTFNFPPSRNYGDRRSQRHLTEGFGRATAMARQ